MVRPVSGNIAIVSQSGGILVDQMVKFAGQGIGLSRAIGLGNKAVINEIDMLKFFARDDMTEVIAFYIEGFGPGQGREFVTAASRCPKPVIVMKAGKSEAGGRAVSSHTASIAGDYKVFSSIMKQFGVVEAMDDLRRGRTVLLVAHRLTTVRNADWVYVVDQGRITEQGTHEDLLAKNGFYADIYNSQFEAADLY